MKGPNLSAIFHQYSHVSIIQEQRKIMTMIGKCAEHSSNAFEVRDGYPHTPLGCNKIILEILNVHSQCIEVKGCFCQDEKYEIFQNLFSVAMM